MGLGTALIRADASPEIGTGHVMRCLALAQAWQDHGGQAYFAMAQSTAAIQARLHAENCPVISVSAAAGSADDAEHTMVAARMFAAEWLVLDGYSFRQLYRQQVRRGGQKLLCLDDCGGEPGYDADIILNQNLTAAESWYPQRSIGAQLLLGTRYCLLRREFAAWRLWNREIATHARRVVATMGGGTPKAVGICVLEALALIENIDAVFVVGGSSPHSDYLATLAAKLPNKASVQRDVSNMAELMAWADIAVSAAGSTCWELCLMGLPSLLIDLAGNQTPVARKLDSQGYALHIGDAENLTAHRVAREIKNLLAAEELRWTLSRRGRELVDGCGAERVVAIMQRATRDSVVVHAEGSLR